MIDEEYSRRQLNNFLTYIANVRKALNEGVVSDPTLEVSEFFETSYESATYAVRRAKARIGCGEAPKEYELRLIRNILGAMRGGDSIG